MSNQEPAREYVHLVKSGMWFISVAGFVFVLIYFKNLFQPLMIALIIWYLIKLVKDLIGKVNIKGRHLPRWLRNVIAALLIFGISGSVVHLLVINIEQVIIKLPEYERKQDDLISKTVDYLDIDNLSDELQNLPKSSEFRPLLTNTLNTLTFTMGQLIVIIIYTVFLIIEESIFMKKLRIINLESKKGKENKIIFDRIAQSVKSYAQVKLFASFLTGGLSLIVLYLLKVDFPFLWAFLIFVLNFIPYVGSFIATLLPSFFAAVQFGDFTSFIKVFIFIQIVQTLVANVIEPKIVGRTLNLSPLVVMICLSFWASIWGILGMMIAVPVTSVLVIIMSQFNDTRRFAIMLSGTGEIDEIGKKQTNFKQ
jgi:AI-2 transport protein TqsA